MEEDGKVPWSEAVLGGGAERCWQKSPRKDAQVLCNPTWAAALAIRHYTSCTGRCLVGGRKKAVVLEMGQQKVRNRRAGEREGSPPLLS